MTHRFPDKISETLGQFTLLPPIYSEPELTRTGLLRYQEREIELEVSPSFTPTIQWEQREDNTWIGQPPDSEPFDMVVLGTLSVNPGEVTLWGVNTVRQRSLGMEDPFQQAPNSQVMHADWCLTGAHLSDPQTRFQEIHLDITNLHKWAGLRSISHKAPEDKSEFEWSWTLNLPESPQTPLISAGGKIKLVPLAHQASISSSEINLSTRTIAVITLDSGLRLEDTLSQFGAPLANLMTILSSSRSSIRNMKLATSDDNRVDVFGYKISPSSPQNEGDLFLLRNDVEGNFLAKWFKLCTVVSPVPDILAAAHSGEFSAIDTEALTLVTTAEMLHRLLHPNEKRFTDDEMEESKQGVKAANIPHLVKETLLTALGKWWADKSYPQRLEQLAEPVAKAVPSCVGKMNKWKQQVVKLRVSAAHGLLDNQNSSDLIKAFTLTRSLRWMLTFRLLLAAGVTPETLQKAADRSDRYTNDASRWKNEWPEIFSHN